SPLVEKAQRAFALPPFRVALVGPPPLAPWEIEVIAKKLPAYPLELLSGVMADRGLGVQQSLDQPLDPVLPTRTVPPRHPACLIRAKVLAGQHHQRPVRSACQRKVGVAQRGDQRRCGI